MNRGIRNITIKGFKSFREVVDFKLNDLNIIIGANGAGKSNFIQIFHMLSAMINNRFSDYIRSNGGADSFLFNGPKETSKMEIAFDFISSGNGVNSYDAEFRPTVDPHFFCLKGGGLMLIPGGIMVIPPWKAGCRSRKKS